MAVAPDEYARTQGFVEQLLNHALAQGDTAPGEHEIGPAKRQSMAAEYGAALDWMRRLKALVDSQGLLNPGKIIYSPAVHPAHRSVSALDRQHNCGRVRRIVVDSMVGRDQGRGGG